MRLRMLGAVVVVAAVIAGAGLSLAGGNGPGNGPLEGETGGVVEGQPLPVGEVYDFASASTLLKNPGDEPVTVERVRVLGVAGPMELLEVRSRLVRPKADGTKLTGGGLISADQDEKYPTLQLAEQDEVPPAKDFFPDGSPAEGLQIVFRLRVPRAGVARSEAMEVTYTVGGKRHRETYPYSMFLCAPEQDFPKGCPGPEQAPYGEDTLG